MAFHVQALFRQYEIKKSSSGKMEALRWLRESFDELKQQGIVSNAAWQGDDEVVGIRFSLGRFGMSYGFGDFTEAPEAQEKYRKQWMAKLPEMQRQAKVIGDQLRQGNMIVFSFAFERTARADERVIAGLRAAAQRK